jgi:hypothetical protein
MISNDKCIIWHYGTIMIVDGETWRVARYYCWIFHGPPPNLPSTMLIPTIVRYVDGYSAMHYSHNPYHATHSCGNGHLPCINPHHLSWKTPFQNRQDAKWHKVYGKRPIPKIEW